MSFFPIYSKKQENQQSVQQSNHQQHQQFQFQNQQQQQIGQRLQTLHSTQFSFQPNQSQLQISQNPRMSQQPFQQQQQFQQIQQQQPIQQQYQYQQQQQQQYQVNVQQPILNQSNNNFNISNSNYQQRIISPRQKNKFQKSNDVYQRSPDKDLQVKRYFGRNFEDNYQQNQRQFSPRMQHLRLSNNNYQEKKDIFSLNVNNLPDTTKKDNERVLNSNRKNNEFSQNYQLQRPQSQISNRQQYLDNYYLNLNKENQVNSNSKRQVRIYSPSQKLNQQQQQFQYRNLYSPNQNIQKSQLIQSQRKFQFSPIRSGQFDFKKSNYLRNSVSVISPPKNNLYKNNNNINNNSGILDVLNKPLFQQPKSPLKYDPSKRFTNKELEKGDHEQWRNEFIANNYKFNEIDEKKYKEFQEQQKPLFQSKIQLEKSVLPQDLIIDNRGKLDTYQELFPVQNKEFPQTKQSQLLDIKQSQMSTTTPYNFAKFESQTQALSSFAFIGNLDYYQGQNESPGYESKRLGNSQMENSQFYQNFSSSRRYYQNADELKKQIKKENSIFEQPLEKFQSKFPIEHYSNKKQKDNANFKMSSYFDVNTDIKSVFQPPELYENQTLKYVSWSSWADKPGKPEFHEEFVFTQKEISFYEQELERLRIQLIGRPDFSIDLLYKYFDIDGVHDIDYKELIQGFKKFNVNAKPIHVFFMIIRYSRDGDFEISIEEFKRLFYSQSISKERQEQIENNNEAQSFSKDTTQLITQILKMLLNEEDAAEFYRNYLKDNNVDIKKIFFKITNLPEFDDKAKLTRYQYADALLYNGLYLKEKEVKMLFSRYDRQEKGFVDWKEFIFELTPQDYLFKRYIEMMKNQQGQQRQKKIKPKFEKQADININNNNNQNSNPFMETQKKHQQQQQFQQQTIKQGESNDNNKYNLNNINAPQMQLQQQQSFGYNQQQQEQQQQQQQQQQLFQQQQQSVQSSQQQQRLSQQSSQQQQQQIQFQNNFLQQQNQNQNIQNNIQHDQNQHQQQQQQQQDQSQKALLEAQQQMFEQREREKQELIEKNKQLEQLKMQKLKQQQQQQQQEEEYQNQQMLLKQQQELQKQKEQEEFQQHQQSQKMFQQSKKQQQQKQFQEEENNFQNDQWSEQGRQNQDKYNNGQNYEEEEEEDDINKNQFGDFDQNDFDKFDNNNNQGFGNFNDF